MFRSFWAERMVWKHTFLNDGPSVALKLLQSSKATAEMCVLIAKAAYCLITRRVWLFCRSRRLQRLCWGLKRLMHARYLLNQEDCFKNICPRQSDAFLGCLCKIWNGKSLYFQNDRHLRLSSYSTTRGRSNWFLQAILLTWIIFMHSVNYTPWSNWINAF